MEQLILDHMLKEEFSFPDSSFPIQFYIASMAGWAGAAALAFWI